MERLSVMSSKQVRARRLIAASFAAVVLGCFVVLASAAAQSVGEEGAAATAADPETVKWALLSAAISTGLSCVGAGVAVAYVGSAAVGAVAEKPQIAGRTLIFVGLAEGIAIYGLIVAIMCLGKV